jgi:hypothetical protein
VKFRKKRLQRAQDAITLPGNEVPWPPSLCDLENGFEFEWRASNPHHNIIPLTGHRGSAALVYLAEEADDSVVDRTHQKLLQGLRSDAVVKAMIENKDVADAVVRAQDRLCVVYRREHRYCIRGPEGLNLINNPAVNSAVGILGDRHD